MELRRREALLGLLAGGLATGVRGSSARAASEIATVSLDNGLRVHLLANDSRYVSAALTLRSREIPAQGGLAHILEHTSFTGAAGSFTAQQVKEMRRTCIQEGNATTEPGMIQWEATFLPRHLEQALCLLAVTSLDQNFDVDTVRSEARVVLQELHLESNHVSSRPRRMLQTALFGRDHPLGIDTTEAEVAKAQSPPERLAAELRAYARTIRLPANMDLFLVGGFDPALARSTVEDCFGRYPFARGPMLDLPRAAVTRRHTALSVPSPELRRPQSEIQIAWNTGVCIGHPDAGVMLALSEYLNGMLFRQLRERYGDTYDPRASYAPDECSGILEIAIPSTGSLRRIERRVFEGIARLKIEVDSGELSAIRDCQELQRRKAAESNNALLARMVDKTLRGASVHDLDLERVTPQDVVRAAQTYLPAYRGTYVRLALRGR